MYFILWLNTATLQKEFKSLTRAVICAASKRDIEHFASCLTHKSTDVFLPFFNHKVLVRWENLGLSHQARKAFLCTSSCPQHRPGSSSWHQGCLTRSYSAPLLITSQSIWKPKTPQGFCKFCFSVRRTGPRASVSSRSSAQCSGLARLDVLELYSSKVLCVLRLLRDLHV